jgi:hypothetical protein
VTWPLPVGGSIGPHAGPPNPHVSRTAADAELGRFRGHAERRPSAPDSAKLTMSRSPPSATGGPSGAVRRPGTHTGSPLSTDAASSRQVSRWVTTEPTRAGRPATDGRRGIDGTTVGPALTSATRIG